MFCTLELKRKMAIKSTETTLGVSAVPGALLALACSLLFKPFRLQQRGAYRVSLLLFPLRFPCWAFPWMERLSDPTMLRFHITNCYSILLLRGLLSCLALIAFFSQRNMPFALKRGCAGLEPTPHGCGNCSKSAGQNWLIPLCSRDLPQVRQVEATALVSFL